jgi:hypothetical protein
VEAQLLALSRCRPLNREEPWKKTWKNRVGLYNILNFISINMNTQWYSMSQAVSGVCTLFIADPCPSGTHQASQGALAGGQGQRRGHMGCHDGRRCGSRCNVKWADATSAR